MYLVKSLSHKLYVHIMHELNRTVTDYCPYNTYKIKEINTSPTTNRAGDALVLVLFRHQTSWI